MATIYKGTVVQIDSGVGGKPAVAPWTPSSYEEPALSTSQKVLGVTMTDSDDGQPVAVMKQGYLRDMSDGAETWAVGDIIYAASGGTLTKTRPAGPLPQVIVGTVFSANGSNWDIDINLRVLPAIGELSGVTREAPVNLDVLIYNGTTHAWVPRQIDHGSDIAGLLDDDHPQYLTPARHSDEMHRPVKPAPHTHLVQDIIGAGTGSGSGDPMMPMAPRPHTHGGEDVLITIQNVGSGTAISLGDFILASQIFGS